MLRFLLTVLVLALYVPPAPLPPAAPTAPAAPARQAAPPRTLWVATASEDQFALIAALIAERSATLPAPLAPLDVVRVDPATLRQTLLSYALLQRQGPDLLWASGDDLAELAYDGLIQPIAPLSGFTLLPAALVGANRDGETWGYPLLLSQALLLYRNPALAPAPPATTDDLIVAARARYPDQALGLAMPWEQGRWLLAMLAGFGGSPLDQRGQPNLQSPEMRAAMDLLLELRASAPADPPNYATARRRFGNGNVALSLDGDWGLPIYRLYSETVQLAFDPLPRVPATGLRMAAPLVGTYLLLPSTSDAASAELARALASALLADEAQIALALGLGHLPANRAVLGDPALQADPLLAALLPVATGPGMPPTTAMRCALLAIEAENFALTDGQRTQDEAMAAMQRRAETCLNAP